MARREYENKGGGLPEGCILYLPLTKEGDLKDRVTGNSLVIENTGGMSWDAAKGAYLIKSNATAHFGYLNYPDFLAQFINGDNYTLVCDAEGEVWGSTIPFLRPNSSVTLSYNSWSFGNINNWERGKVRISMTFDATYRTYYCNRTQISQSTIGSRVPYTPSRWGTISSPELYAGYSTSAAGQYYMYRFMLFNRKLTLDEIMSL